MKDAQVWQVDFSNNPFYHCKEGLLNERTEKKEKEKQEHNFEYFTEKRRNPKELKAYIRRKVDEFNVDKFDDENIK